MGPCNLTDQTKPGPGTCLGVGKSLITDKMLSKGAIPDGVIFKPANITVSLQNWNFLSFITVPLSAQSSKKPQV